MLLQDTAGHLPPSKAGAPGLDPSAAAWPVSGWRWPGTPSQVWGLSDSVWVLSHPHPHSAGCMLGALSCTDHEKKMKHRASFSSSPMAVFSHRDPSDPVRHAWGGFR